MQPWSTWKDQSDAIRRACSRAGCTVLSIEPKPTSFGVYVQARITCPTTWSAATLLALIAEADAQTAGARAYALELRAGATDGDFVQKVFDRGRRLRFVREPGEVFTSPSYTLSVNAGDCDDHARTTYAVLRAGGVPARIVFLHKGPGGDPSHAVTQAFVNGAWTWLETTLAANFGESPMAAASRLGIGRTRTDIADHATVINLRTLQRTSAMLGALASALICVGPLTMGDASAMFTPTQIATYEKAANTSDLSGQFMVDVSAMAARLRTIGANVSGEDLLAVWNGESGISPKARNPAGAGAYGLNQLYGAPMLAAVGWAGTVDDYLSLSAEAQLPCVERYYLKYGPKGSGWRRIDGARGLYAINGWPTAVAMGADTRDDNAILGTKGKRDYYPEFDTAGAGVNTPSQIDAWIARAQKNGGARWIEARARFWIEAGDTPPTRSVFRVAGVGVGAAAAIALGAWLAWES